MYLFSHYLRLYLYDIMILFSVLYLCCLVGGARSIWTSSGINMQQLLSEPIKWEMLNKMRNMRHAKKQKRVKEEWSIHRENSSGRNGLWEGTYIGHSSEILKAVITDMLTVQKEIMFKELKKDMITTAHQKQNINRN